jgi:hypothetical protein
VVLSVEASAALLGLPKSGRYEKPLEVVWTATDERGGRRTGTAYDATLAIDASRLETVRRHGVRILSDFALPPGRYQIRVTVRSARTDSVVSTLTVPEFAEPLTMGGVVMSSLSATQAPTFTPDTSRLTLPMTPTTRREFESGEAIGLFTEVYESPLRLDRSPARGTTADPGGAGDHTTHLVLELHDDDGSILQIVAADHSIDRRRAGSHSFVARLGLDVPPGRYTIRLRARTNIGDPDSVTRDIQIRVKPKGSLGKGRSFTTSRA